VTHDVINVVFFNNIGANWSIIFDRVI